MQIELSTSDINALRKLQRNLAGSPDYARVTCILMLGMGNPPSFVAECLGIDSATVYRYRSAFLHGGGERTVGEQSQGLLGKKTTKVPCEADASIQEEFMPELSATFKEKEEIAVFYYADGVHPTHNSRSTKALYEAALERYPEASKIYIISDNAKYYRNKELQEWVKGTKGAFKKAVMDFFAKMGCYKEELESLLTLDFRLINSQTISS